MNSRTNWLGVMFRAFFYMAQRPGHKENWSEIIWRALKCGAGSELTNSMSEKLEFLNNNIMSLLHFLSKSVYPAVGLKNLISASIFLLSDYNQRKNYIQFNS